LIQLPIICGKVLEILDLQPGQKVADIGSGGGYYELRFALSELRVLDVPITPYPQKLRQIQCPQPDAGGCQGKSFGDLALHRITWATEIGIGSK
jgi:hypothetical protein